MKYKALISGRRTYLKEIFIHMTDKFDLMSTSDIWEDTVTHFKLFEPDVYVCMYDDYTDEIFTKLKELRRSSFAENVPIVAVADDDGEERIKTRVPELNLYIIKRPASAQTIKEKLFDDVNEWKAYLASKEAEEAAAAAAAEAAREEMERKKEGVTSSDFSPDKKNILIIDDDKTVLKMLKAALEDDYNVTAMAGSKMAYRFLETKPVDLILLDYEMPLESGPEVLKRIRNEMKMTDVPVVFLTGVSDSSKIKEVLQLKPQGYLLKPIDIDRLNKTIKELVG